MLKKFCCYLIVTMINRGNESFTGDEVVKALSEEAERNDGQVEFNGEVATCYEDGEEVAQVTVYADNEAGGSVASVGFDSEGHYAEALDTATEDVEGVGYEKGQVKQLGPAVI